MAVEDMTKKSLDKKTKLRRLCLLRYPFLTDIQYHEVCKDAQINLERQDGHRCLTETSITCRVLEVCSSLCHRETASTGMLPSKELEHTKSKTVNRNGNSSMREVKSTFIATAANSSPAICRS